MTLREVTHQLFQLSTDGRFNGQQHTEASLRDYIASRTGGDKPSAVYMEMNLPDGAWHFEVVHMPKISKGFYDYFLPANREQEQIVLRHIAADEQARGQA